MPFRFSIFSTDDPDPDKALDVTSWKPDPIEAQYDPRFEWVGRGAHVATLGGMVHQDTGLNIKDRKIFVGGRDMSNALRAELETKYVTVDTEWNFADGLGDVFRVRFARDPRGFIAILDAALYAKGIFTSNPPALKYVRYKYEITLLVISQTV